VTEQPPRQPTASDKLALVAMVIAGVMTALIVFVIVVGVFQGELNPTAVATMLGGILTTIMGLLFAAYLKTNGKDKE
jgi:hypothetical protein